jgi:serine/threonine protein kinase
MPGGLAAGQLVDERYALEEPIGEDALGTVWRAHDNGLGRTVRLRDVRFSDDLFGHDPSRLAAALTRARTAIRVDHPRAVHVYDAFLDGDRLMLVTELVGGRPLADVVERKGPMHAKRVAAIGLDVLEALTAAHSIGIVHGMVSPALVLVADRGPSLLSGFGLAPAFDDPAAGAWVEALGSPPYLAPEQVNAIGEGIEAAPGPAADFWSLGATLYYAVEGTDAFESSGDAVGQAPRPPSRAGRLGPVLEQLLVEEPDGRVGADDLRRQLADVAGIDLDAPPAEDRRRSRRERRRADAEDGPSETMADETPPADEHDWSAVLRPPEDGGAKAGEWADWSAGVGGDASDVWLPGTEAQVLATPPAPETAPARRWSPETADARTEFVDSVTASAAPPPPASAPPEETTERPAPEPEPERKYRSTPSWPPPKQRRIGVTVLCGLCVFVMVALLVTNGRSSKSSNTTSGPTVPLRQRPVLSTDPASVPSAWEGYRNSEIGFGISYPPSWTLREDASSVTIREPTTGTQLRIDYTSPPGQDPEQTFTSEERTFPTQHPDYHRLQLSPANYLGHVAALWEFTYTDGNIAAHAVNLTVLTKHHRVTLSFEAPAASWDTMLPVFHGFLSSFRAPD